MSECFTLFLRDLTPAWKELTRGEEDKQRKKMREDEAFCEKEARKREGENKLSILPTLHCILISISHNQGNSPLSLTCNRDHIYFQSAWSPSCYSHWLSPLLTNAPNDWLEENRHTDKTDTKETRKYQRNASETENRDQQATQKRERKSRDAETRTHKNKHQSKEEGDHRKQAYMYPVWKQENKMKDKQIKKQRKTQKDDKQQRWQARTNRVISYTRRAPAAPR